MEITTEVTEDIKDGDTVYITIDETTKKATITKKREIYETIEILDSLSGKVNDFFDKAVMDILYGLIRDIQRKKGDTLNKEEIIYMLVDIKNFSVYKSLGQHDAVYDLLEKIKKQLKDNN